MIDATQIGQAIVALLVIVAFVISHRAAKETKTKTEEIHILVNSRLEEALSRISDLERSLGLNKGEPAPPPR